MRRIIEGKAYNTETATQVASATAADGKAPFRSATLLLNRDGRYFIHYERTDLLAGASGKGPDADEVIRLIRTPDDLAEFHKQAREYPWQVHDEGAWKRLTEAVSAPAGKRRKADPASGGAVLLIRVPQSLKARVERAAEAEGVSINAWVMRKLERILAEAG